MIREYSLRLRDRRENSQAQRSPDSLSTKNRIHFKKNAALSEKSCAKGRRPIIIFIKIFPSKNPCKTRYFPNKVDFAKAGRNAAHPSSGENRPEAGKIYKICD